MRWLALTSLAMTAFVAGGCSAKPVVVHYRPAIALETYSINPPHAVFDAPTSSDVPTQPPALQAWYASRNDVHLSHRPGATEARGSTYLIDIYDRQTTSHDNARDYYHRRTRSFQWGAGGQ